ncbi:hypothetical protein OPV22_030258 [Ensete ventricosum]|uniref:Uncharacterized protein n=1 Tax=Ensete ventricosum TaxID=4639 RepID=A0AAV8QDN3_ENSVE|nr:hypothetical protein OPV22_030258 [Ensete ventricosum]
MRAPTHAADNGLQSDIKPGPVWYQTRPNTRVEPCAFPVHAVLSQPIWLGCEAVCCVTHRSWLWFGRLYKSSSPGVPPSVARSVVARGEVDSRRVGWRSAANLLLSLSSIVWEISILFVIASRIWASVAVENDDCSMNL